MRAAWTRAGRWRKTITPNGRKRRGIRTYHDYRDVLAAREIDAVVITVPDHSHARLAIAAAIAGKHVYVQKPVTYNIAEAIGLRRTVEATKIILQTGSQQRSERPWHSFRGGERSRAQRPDRSIADHQDWHRFGPPQRPSARRRSGAANWILNAGWVPPRNSLTWNCACIPSNSLDGRPGWITTEDFGLGMITNWGAHHVDIAHWAMGQELGGPLTMESEAQFMHERRLDRSYQLPCRNALSP